MATCDLLTSPTKLELKLKFWSHWRPHFWAWNHKRDKGRSWGVILTIHFVQFMVNYNSTGYYDD